MSLFTKPIQDILFQDVVDFCEAGNSENSVLEYKSELPNNKSLAKIISAFANTYGGLLIVGVKASSDGKPTGPFVGINLDPKISYEEKIENICFSHIKEPLFPEIKICEAVKGKTFILVKVSESNLTPHRITENTTIYVRTGQSSIPNEKADWDKIGWLMSRREKSLDLKKRLKANSEEYFENACKIEGVDINNKDYYFGVFSLGSLPIFPNEPFLHHNELQNIEEKISISGTNRFPYNLYNPKLIQHGIHKLYIPQGYINKTTNKPTEGASFYYTNINTFGLYLYKEDVGDIDKIQTEKSEEKTIKRISYYAIVRTTKNYILSLLQFYRHIGYSGNIEIKINLRNALGIKVVHPLSSDSIFWGDEEDEHPKVPTNEIILTKEFNLKKLEEKFSEILIDLLLEFAWALGIKHLNKERMEKIIKNAR